MAKTSMLARERKRQRLASQFRGRRDALKRVASDRKAEPDERAKAILLLQKLPRDASPTRQQRRCRVTGRPHAVYRKFGLGRNMLRAAVMRGDVPGVVKASW
jgi:small subunit ribosomal protein S14